MANDSERWCGMFSLAVGHGSSRALRLFSSALLPSVLDLRL